jgi:hypothetical protein
VFLFVLAAASWAAGAEIFAARGDSHDPALALSRARADAGAQALWRYISSRMETEPLQRNFSRITEAFLNQSQAYIKSNRVLTMRRSGNLTEVMAEVEVEESALGPALDRLSLPSEQKAAARPLLCLVSELAGPGRPPLYWWSEPGNSSAAFASLTGELEAFGFTPLLLPAGQAQTIPPPPDLTLERALEAGRALNADLLLLGRVRLYPLREERAAALVPAASFTLLNPRENLVLAQVEAQGPVQGSGEEAEARLRGEINEALDKLFELAGLKAAPPVSARLRLEYQGLHSAAQLTRLERLLTLLGGAVINSHRESMSAGKAVLILDSRIDAQELAERMRSNPELMKEIEILQQSEDTVIIRPAAR